MVCSQISERLSHRWARTVATATGLPPSPHSHSRPAAACDQLSGRNLNRRDRLDTPSPRHQRDRWDRAGQCGYGTRSPRSGHGCPTCYQLRITRGGKLRCGEPNLRPVDLAVADDGPRHTVRRQQLPPPSPPEEPPLLSPPENHPPPLEPLSQEAPPSPPAVALGTDDAYADEPRRPVAVRRRARKVKTTAAANSPKKISMSTTVRKPINLLCGLRAQSPRGRQSLPDRR